MNIISKQIGWSVESNLLWEVLFQLNKLRTLINKPPVLTSVDTTGFNFNLSSGCTYTFNIKCGNQIILFLPVNRTSPNNITNLATYFDNVVYQYPWLGEFSLNGSVITLNMNGDFAKLTCPNGIVGIGVGGSCPA